MTFATNCPNCGTHLTGEHCVSLQSLSTTVVCQCGTDVEIPVELGFTATGLGFSPTTKIISTPHRWRRENRNRAKASRWQE